MLDTAAANIATTVISLAASATSDHADITRLYVDSQDATKAGDAAEGRTTQLANTMDTAVSRGRGTAEDVSWDTRDASVADIVVNHGTRVNT